MRLSLASFVSAFALTALFAPSAFAGGGSYTFSGGTASERATVTQALDVSSFNWSVVGHTVNIQIARGISSEATPGTVWLDADLLDSGTFSWGVVQHEYAHQVDFFVLNDAQRTVLTGALGGVSWWPTGTAPIPHSDMTGERFASTLAWAYWSSSDNAMKPASINDESGHVPPAQFRALLQQLLGPEVNGVVTLNNAPAAAPVDVVAKAPVVRRKRR